MQCNDIAEEHSWDENHVQVLSLDFCNWTAQPDLDGQMSVFVCHLSSVVVCLSSAVSKTADIMTLSVSFRYVK